MAITITSPVEGYTATTEFGPLRLDFVDGVATTDEPVSEGHFAYFREHGFGVELGDDENSGDNVALFDPSENKVEDVLAYLAGLDDSDPVAHDAEVVRVLEAEQAGKNRSTLLESIGGTKVPDGGAE
ncbi:MAG: hypothetical protein IIZ13_08240 [Renibacterium sp.]|nr:hypothetical protein [Renibacterium sp.]